MRRRRCAKTHAPERSPLTIARRVVPVHRIVLLGSLLAFTVLSPRAIPQDRYINGWSKATYEEFRNACATRGRSRALEIMRARGEIDAQTSQSQLSDLEEKLGDIFMRVCECAAAEFMEKHAFEQLELITEQEQVAVMTACRDRVLGIRPSDTEDQ